MLSTTPIGARVVVSRDCRDGEPATGKAGIYLGDMPQQIYVKPPTKPAKPYPFSAEVLDWLEECQIKEYFEAVSEPARQRYFEQTGFQFPIPKGFPEAEGMKHFNAYLEISNALEREAWHWFLHRSPLIAVGDIDGEVDYVWGCECYWRELKPDEEPQPEQEAAKADRWAGMLATTIAALAEAGEGHE